MQATCCFPAIPGRRGRREGCKPARNFPTLETRNCEGEVLNGQTHQINHPTSFLTLRGIPQPSPGRYGRMLSRSAKHAVGDGGIGTARTAQ